MIEKLKKILSCPIDCEKLESVIFDQEILFTSFFLRELKRWYYGIKVKLFFNPFTILCRYYCVSNILSRYFYFKIHYHIKPGLDNNLPNLFCEKGERFIELIIKDEWNLTQ